MDVALPSYTPSPRVVSWRTLGRSGLDLMAGSILPAFLMATRALGKLGRVHERFVGGAYGDPASVLGHYAQLSYQTLSAVFLGVVAVFFVVRKHPLRKLTRLTPR